MPQAAIEAERIAVEQPPGSTTRCCSRPSVLAAVRARFADARSGDPASRDSA